MITEKTQLTRKDLANPYSNMTYEEQLKKSTAINLINNCKIINKNSKYILIEPIDNSKTF